MNGSDPKASELTAYTKAMNLFPVCFVAAGAGLVLSIAPFGGKIGCAVIWIYLVPPLTCRCVLAVWGEPYGRNLTQDTNAYKIWWFLVQVQVLHNRFPALEELLRLAPGLYAAWIWLWGGNVSPMAYWGPGSRVSDRYLVKVDRHAVIGTQAGLAGHMGTVDAQGCFRVDIAAPHVGAGAIVGARGGLGPGATLAAGTMLPPARLLPSFSHWPRAAASEEVSP